jgi:hypothetical protein
MTSPTTTRTPHSMAVDNPSGSNGTVLLIDIHPRPVTNPSRVLIFDLFPRSTAHLRRRHPFRDAA